MAQCLQATGEMGLNLSTSRPLERRLLFMGRWGGGVPETYTSTE